MPMKKHPKRPNFSHHEIYILLSYFKQTHQQNSHMTSMVKV